MKRFWVILGCVVVVACQPSPETPADDAGAGDGGAAAEAPASRTQPETAAPVAAASAGDTGGYGEIGLELPATFTGTLPCADCPGIAWHLDLWPDGVFHLAREYLERERVEYDIGRWRKDPARDAIMLYGGREMPEQFSIEGPRTLRKLDIEGKPIESGLPYELTSDGTLERTDVRLGMSGEFRYMADAAVFAECLTGRSYPVAMEDAYIELERAYLAADKPEPGAAILARVEAEITDRPPMEGDRDVPTLVVQRFIGLYPDQTCERAMSEASLVGTYWKITEMQGEAVEPVENHREPRIIFRVDEPRYSATVGCNMVNGAFEVEGDELRLMPGPTTLMACPPPLDALERTLMETIGVTRGWKITQQTLELFDETGRRVARLEAVYLP